MKNLLYVSIYSFAFMLTYISFNATQNIIAIILDKNGFGNLGFHSLALIYLSWGLVSLISANIVRKIGLRRSLVSGAVSNTILTLTYLLPICKSTFPNSDSIFTDSTFIYTAILLSSIVNGLMTGPMWISIFQIVQECASAKHLGFYYSYFQMFYISSQIFGSMISAFVFGIFSELYFFLIMSLISASAALLFNCVRYPKLLKEDTFI